MNLVCRPNYINKDSVSSFNAESAADIRYLIGSDTDEIRRSSALYLLKLKEHRRISQVAVDDIVEGTKALVHHCVEHMQAGVRAKLSESGVDPSSIEGLASVFKNKINPFDGIETCYLQEKYYHENLA